MKEDNNDDDLSDLIEQSMTRDVGMKKAIETLHPLDKDQKLRLSILTPEEVSAHSEVDLHTKALNSKDLTKGFIIEGFSDSIMARKVSQGGVGRNEIKELPKPQIIGDMMAQGMIPEGMMMNQNRRPGFFARLLGRR